MNCLPHNHSHLAAHSAVQSGQKRKSRILVCANGASVEYENINSDASWETESDDELSMEVKSSGVKGSSSLSDSANKSSNKTEEKKKMRKISVNKPKNSSSRGSIKTPKATKTVGKRKTANSDYVKCKRCDSKLKYSSVRSLRNHINAVYGF